MQLDTTKPQTTTLRFGWVEKKEEKNCSIYTPPCVRGEPRQGDLGRSARPTVCARPGARWRKAAPSMGSRCSRRFLPHPSCYCRGSPSSRPCHGSMLAFLFPASRDCIAAHNSEARAPFRVCDWPSAAEARPKRDAPIGCRSINSDCHVLVVGSPHQDLSWIQSRLLMGEHMGGAK